MLHGFSFNPFWESPWSNDQILCEKDARKTVWPIPGNGYTNHGYWTKWLWISQHIKSWPTKRWNSLLDDYSPIIHPLLTLISHIVLHILPVPPFFAFAARLGAASTSTCRAAIWAFNLASSASNWSFSSTTATIFGGMFQVEKTDMVWRRKNIRHGEKWKTGKMDGCFGFLDLGEVWTFCSAKLRRWTALSSKDQLKLLPSK